MRLILNGEVMETGAATLRELIESLSLRPEGIAVELNQRVIKKSEYGNLKLNDGDKVEVVNFVGGG